MKVGVDHRSTNQNADDADDFDQKPCCQRTACRIVFLLILTLLAIASSVTLAMIYHKDREEEKRLKQKQKNWMKTWQNIRPIFKKLKFEPISATISSLITFAIDEYVKSQAY